MENTRNRGRSSQEKQAKISPQIKRSPGSKATTGGKTRNAPIMSQKTNADQGEEAPTPRNIAVSVFPNLAATMIETRRVDWAGLSRFLVDDPHKQADTKADLRLFIPGEFDGSRTSKGSLRHDSGLVTLHALVIDYDEGQVSLEKAAEIFRHHKCAAVVAPTASWTVAKPKWRAVVPLSRAYSRDTEDDLKTLHRQWVATVRSWGLKASGESDTLSQAYYFGLPMGIMSPVPVSVEGWPIDTLDQAAVEVKETGAYVDETESQQLLSIVATGAPGIHEAMRRLSMTWISRGLDAGTVAELLRNTIDKWGGPGNERWEERRGEIDRLVEGAVRKKAVEAFAEADEPEVKKTIVSELADKLPSIEDARVTEAAMLRELEPEKMIVQGYMIASESGGFIAPGGTGKTTIAIWEAVHIILGWPLYGLEVQRPGPIVFITAEDRKETVERRLNSILKALQLEPGDLKKVCRDFLIVDVSRLKFRLAARNKHDVQPTLWVDALAERFGPVKPAYIHLDPVSLIGPGEDSGNDGMAELMKAARNLAAETGAAIRLVHHTSKEVARTGSMDQYAGRGGAAFADNGRFTHQLIRMQSGVSELKVGGVNYLIPPLLEATQEDFARGRVLGLIRHKLSYAELDSTPIIIKRNGFNFGWAFAIPEMSEQGIEIAQEKAQGANKEKLDQLVNYLTQFGDTGESRRDTVRQASKWGSTQNKAETLIDAALTAGLIEMEEKKARGVPSKVLFVRKVQE